MSKSKVFMEMYDFNWEDFSGGISGQNKIETHHRIGNNKLAWGSSGM